MLWLQPFVIKNDSAYDDTIQAKSGYVDVMRNIVGHASYVPINLADRVTGLHVVYSLLAAIISLQKNKKSLQLHISMYDDECISSWRSYWK